MPLIVLFNEVIPYSIHQVDNLTGTTMKLLDRGEQYGQNFPGSSFGRGNVQTGLSESQQQTKQSRRPTCSVGGYETGLCTMFH